MIESDAEKTILIKALRSLFPSEEAKRRLPEFLRKFDDTFEFLGPFIDMEGEMESLIATKLGLYTADELG